jgi:5-methylcytosine-specific restriction endonuclease McrA
MVNYRRYNLKKRAIEYKGGGCAICGYSKCRPALIFHHINPADKGFTISSKYCLSWERIQKELDKCILLCQNCHSEEHHREQSENKKRAIEFITGKGLVPLVTLDDF